MREEGTLLLPYKGVQPELAEPCFVAPGAHLIGRVRLGPEASVWFNAVLRGDGDLIDIGARTNLQDGVVVHTDQGRPCIVGADCTVGHLAVLHGCRIHDRVLIGMGAIVMNGAEIGEESLVAAGTLVLEDTVVPPGSLVVGRPGKVVRALTDAERERVRRAARHYVQLWREAGWSL